MKYLREVTPYFRKNSALNELGWGNQDTSQDMTNTNWSESKTIPLKLCYLCKNLSMTDSEKRTIELHSPDGKSSCILRFPDVATANEWFNALHANVTMLTAQAVHDANVIMSSAPNQREVIHVGWLSEQVYFPKTNLLKEILLNIIRYRVFSCPKWENTGQSEDKYGVSNLR